MTNSGSGPVEKKKPYFQDERLLHILTVVEDREAGKLRVLGDLGGGKPVFWGTALAAIAYEVSRQVAGGKFLTREQATDAMLEGLLGDQVQVIDLNGEQARHMPD